MYIRNRDLERLSKVRQLKEEHCEAGIDWKSGLSCLETYILSLGCDACHTPRPSLGYASLPWLKYIHNMLVLVSTTVSHCSFVYMFGSLLQGLIEHQLWANLGKEKQHSLLLNMCIVRIATCMCKHTKAHICACIMQIMHAKEQESKEFRKSL